MTTTSSITRRRSLRWPTPTRRPPASLLAITGVVALLAFLPLSYLVIRAVDAGADALVPLARPRTLELVASTFALGSAVATGAIVLGVPLAWLTAHTDLPARRMWSVLAIAPLAVPSYLLAFAFAGALAPRGWLASLLEPIGIAPSRGAHGFGAAALVLTLATTPYVVISTRAALARLDRTTEEAARSLGRGRMGALRTAVLPVIVPAVGAGALLAGLYSISDFGAVSILRYDTLATAIYSQYRFSFDRSGAAILALLLLAMALALVWAEGRIRRRLALATPHGPHRTPPTVRLGPWRWPALALTAGVAALSLGLPAATISLWLYSGLTRDLELSVGLDTIRDSLVLAGGAAIFAVVLALPMARLVVHFPGRAASATERLLYAVYAVPGISLALAIAFFNLHAVPLVYQTLIALVGAVTLRYLVQAVGALRGPMLQVSPRTHEAARSLGEGTFGILRSVTLPLLRPGLVAGVMLVLLSGLKELPLTLLLAPPGFSTLATELWDAAREAFYAQAAVPATLLLVISFASVGLLVRQGERNA